MEYHKERLNNFGKVPINFIEKENHLYFSYTLSYIARCFLEIDNFNSTSCYLSEKFRFLAKKYKVLVDEVIKAMILDEGSIEDKIKVELSNERLVRGLYEIISRYYKLNKLGFREKKAYFKKNSKWDHIVKCWKIEFSSDSFEELYKSISPLPIGYKEDSFKLLYKRKTQGWRQRKSGETKRLIVKSLIFGPKSVSELASFLGVRNGTILFHLNGNHPSFSTSLVELGIVIKVGFTELRRGGYTKVSIYGINDKEKAKKFLEI